MIGTTLTDRYRIEQKLGEGGMGEVYLAEDLRLGRKVALKLLRANLTADPERVHRFEQEARAASALNHPNILTIFEIGRVDGTYFIATEFVDGATLRDLLSAGTLEPKRILEIGAQVDDALAAAHRAGILHRDVKPENIMVRRDGYAKLLDFGLAKLTDVQSGFGPTTPQIRTASGMVVGTIHYMSPEQIEGRIVDHRSDLFSLGCVLYESATGQAPFGGTSFIELMRSITSAKQRSVLELNTAASPELARIIEKCLAKDPRERYQHADELAVDLRRLQRESDAGVSLAKKPTARQRARGTVINSVAVLPLANASADPDTEYLSDGITESLINSLSQLPKLRVMARSTVFRYKGREIDPQAVGRDLRVGAVVIGRVVQRGDSVVIGTELVDVANGWQLWGGNYNRKLSDIFVVQEEITKEITENLRLKLSREENTRLRKRHTENAVAYQAYLKGRFHWNKRTEEGIKRGIEYSLQAIEDDLGYALAYAGLADCYTAIGYYGFLLPREAWERARAAATRALELDDALAEAHASLANIRTHYDWDWPAAEREYRRAIELNPRYAAAHHWYGLHQSVIGRFEEAEGEYRLALEIDPFSLIINTALVSCHYYARQYDRATEQIRKTLDLEPNFGGAHWMLGQIYEALGQFDDAISELTRAKPLYSNSSEVAGSLGHAHAVAGQRREALKILEELTALSERKYVPAHSIALIYGGLGDHDHAFQLLEKAYEERSSRLAYLNVDPVLDSLRPDPRFNELRRRVGLPGN
jgi:serine/threonine-protein kinase